MEEEYFKPVNPTPQEEVFIPVDRNIRLLNYMVDNLLVCGSIRFAILRYFQFLMPPDPSLHTLPWYFWATFLIDPIYYIIAEGTTHRTIGKLLTGTRVVTEYGEKPAFSAILLRTLCRYVPFEPFSFLGADQTGWHDKWSKTRVVKV